jgi:N-hydroxyarylamine O-acetyltransferase
VNDDTAAAYLRRLALPALLGEPPSVDGLQQLVRAHVATVPYETVWIHLGEPWTTDTQASAQRVAHQRRGGYCYHLNGALSELLAHLGYSVHRHVGGVHGPDGPNLAAMSNHLVLTVHGLPTEANPQGRWYVDAGLGDGPTAALPMIPGEYTTDHFSYRLVDNRSEDGPTIGDWAVRHDPKGSFAGMVWLDAPATMDDFDASHVQLSTSPDSGFVRTLTAQRRHADGVTIVRGVVRTQVGVDEVAPLTVEHADDWYALLADEFGLTLDHVDAAARAALWRRVITAHEAHLASEDHADDA